MNKYIVTLLLISSSIAFAYDYIGATYLIIYMIHTFAYYSFRSKIDSFTYTIAYNEPIDVLFHKRGNRRDMKGFFSILFVTLCLVTFICTITARLIDGFIDVS